jgi:hypothetical protein
MKRIRLHEDSLSPGQWAAIVLMIIGAILLILALIHYKP